VRESGHVKKKPAVLLTLVQKVAVMAADEQAASTRGQMESLLFLGIRARIIGLLKVELMDSEVEVDDMPSAGMSIVDDGNGEMHEGCVISIAKGAVVDDEDRSQEIIGVVMEVLVREACERVLALVSHTDDCLHVIVGKVLESSAHLYSNDRTIGFKFRMVVHVM